METLLPDFPSIIKRAIIIFLGSTITDQNGSLENTLNDIRYIIDFTKAFVNIDEFINFLNNNKNERLFIIITDSFHEQYTHLINLIEETIQIDSVYILHNDSSKENNWKNNCKKFKGIFSHIKHICNALEQTICSFEDEFPIMNNQFLGLDQSYIYFSILTERIYIIKYDDKAIKDAFNYCRDYYSNDEMKLNEINVLEQNYLDYSPIWWHTKRSPINSILQDVLINHNIDGIIKMGFFIQDLHQAIRKIYLENNKTNKFFVYRGQGMLDTDFKKFIKRKGGLYVFNNFLSTSFNEEIAFGFAERAKINSETIGILFQMEIDPSIGSILFASLGENSYYSKTENEVLFSTLTVFKIGEIIQLGDKLWKVKLTLTDDHHQYLKVMTDNIRNETQGITVWHSLAFLLNKMGKYDQALDIFKRIQAVDDDNRENSMAMSASTENNIGSMYSSMGDYSSALKHYENAQEIQKQSLPLDDSSAAIVCKNIEMVHLSMGDLTQALLCLENRSESSSSNQTSLITSYCDTGMIYELKGDYLTALSYYEKDYENQKSFLPLDHPSLALIYNKLGGIYSLTGEYSTALSYYEKTLKIQSKSLLSDHPLIANSYNNIGYVYQLMGDYRTSLIYYDKAMDIQKKCSFKNRLSLATTFNNIGLVYRLIGDYIKSLSYYSQALIIEECFLTSDHPSLALTYNNLGTVYQFIGEFLMSLKYYDKTLKIWQNIYPPNHPSLATIHNNMGSLHDSMKNYDNALLAYRKAVEILINLPSCNQLELATIYNNIGETYRSMADYSNALIYYRKTIEIEEKYFPAKHPSLSITITNMAVAFDGNNQHEEAFDHAQKALDILCDSLGSKHSQTINTRIFLDQLRQKLPSI